MTLPYVLCSSPAGFHRMAYRQWGSADNPRVLVCVHGLTRNGADFEPLAQALCRHYRVLSVDIVGRGASDWLADPSRYVYPQYLGDMTALIARSGAQQVDWVGTSMGGFLGMMMAAMRGSPIRRLVMNDVGPFIPRAALERIAGYVGNDPRFADRDELERTMREIYAPFGPFTDAQWQAMVDSSLRETPEGNLGFAYDPRIAVPLTAQPAADVDAWTLWDRVSAPVLLLRGERSDLLLEETAREMCERGPGARLHEVPGVGHAPSLMSGAQIDAVREFLLEG
jgi:pimeloyl-ACP methyl ester carboxylesterase